MFLKSVPIVPRLLGIAGLLPQLACVLSLAYGGDEQRYIALSVAFGYSALIFSFLGGMWWGLAAAHPQTPGWIYAAAVAPSLIALLCYLPWILGEEWPQPSLGILGIFILLTPLIDRRLAGLKPDWWMSLRWFLSLGLGALTLSTAML